MEYIFQELDHFANAALWGSAVASKPVHSGEVFEQISPGVFVQTALELRPPFLCSSSANTLLTWKRLTAFTEVYSNKALFGFTLTGYHKKTEFYTLDEWALSQWLEWLTPTRPLSSCEATCSRSWTA